MAATALHNECSRLFRTSTKPLVPKKPPPPTCVVCFEDVVSNKRVLGCEHVFHASCVDGWMRERGTCPTCRTRERKRIVFDWKYSSNARERDMRSLAPEDQERFDVWVALSDRQMVRHVSSSPSPERLRLMRELY